MAQTLFATFSNCNDITDKTEYFWLHYGNGAKWQRMMWNDFSCTYGDLESPVCQFQHQNIQDIPAGVPYNIYIYVGYHNGEQQKRKLSPITPEISRILNNTYEDHPDWKRVLNDAQQGLVNFWFDFSTEKMLYGAYPNFWEWLWRIRDRLGCGHLSHHLHLITGAEVCEEFTRFKETTGWNLHSVNPFEKWMRHHWDKDADEPFRERLQNFVKQNKYNIESGFTREYRALMYNRVPRPLRAFTLHNLSQLGLLDQTLWSWGVDNLPNRNDWSEKDKWIRNTGLVWGESAGEWLRHIYDTWYGPDVKPKHMPDELHLDLNKNQAHTGNYLHASQCDFKIITETCYNHLPFLTEKTFKSVLMMMPFIMIGPAGNVQAFRNRGYRTFDYYIDHSYDNEPDFMKRHSLAMAEIERLYRINSGEWAAMRRAMLPDLIYNLQLLETRMDMHSAHIFYQ